MPYPTLVPASSDWPSSALGVAEKVFSLLQRGPAPLSLSPHDLGADIPASDQASVAGGVLAGQEPVSLWSLRELVVRRELPVVVVNRMWTLLVTRAQTGGETWTVGAVGMALPALFSLAGDLSGSPRRECADLDAEILGGFLSGLALARPGTRALFPVLLRHARHAGLAWVTAQRLAARTRPLTHASLDRLLTPCTSTHPDQVLAELVAADVLTPQDARLLIATRLEGIPDRQVAAAAGLPYDTLRKRRLRAERKVAAHLTAHRAGSPTSSDRDERVTGRRGGHGGHTVTGIGSPVVAR
jgi:DNA-directed RNA polymerase specialized sigma24 family protein